VGLGIRKVASAWVGLGGAFIFVVHSNSPNIKLVVIKVHVIVRRYVVLTWMCDNGELV
jgi:hypothetical protein